MDCQPSAEMPGAVPSVAGHLSGRAICARSRRTEECLLPDLASCRCRAWPTVRFPRCARLLRLLPEDLILLFADQRWNPRRELHLLSADSPMACRLYAPQRVGWEAVSGLHPRPLPPTRREPGKKGPSHLPCPPEAGPSLLVACA